MANTMNGNARAREKPNSPSIVPLPPPEATSTSSVPTIGAVQEKLTTTRVSAMRKIDTMPVVLLDFISRALPHDCGSAILKRPMNDSPKMTRNMKHATLKPALVDSWFSVFAPKAVVIPTARAMKIAMMERPKSTAPLMPFSVFMKKEMVNGIMGHTQGVSNATSPPRMPRRNMRHPPP